MGKSVTYCRLKVTFPARALTVLMHLTALLTAYSVSPEHKSVFGFVSEDKRADYRANLHFIIHLHSWSSCYDKSCALFLAG